MYFETFFQKVSWNNLWHYKPPFTWKRSLLSTIFVPLKFQFLQKCNFCASAKGRQKNPKIISLGSVTFHLQLNYGIWVYLMFWQAFNDGKQLLLTSCLLPCGTNSFKKRVGVGSVKENNLFQLWSNSFLQEKSPFEMGDNFFQTGFISLAGVPIYHNEIYETDVRQVS